VSRVEWAAEDRQVGTYIYGDWVEGHSKTPGGEGGNKKPGGLVSIRFVVLLRKKKNDRYWPESVFAGSSPKKGPKSSIPANGVLVKSKGLLSFEYRGVKIVGGRSRHWGGVVLV